jgi:hypothetical protein
VRPEDKVQKTIITYIEAVVPNVLVFAIPNASRRRKGGRAGNAVPGLKAGMPDLCFFYGARPYFVEVKVPGGKGLSQVQIDCHRELLDREIDVTSATSIEDVREALADWGIHTREAAHV